MEREKVEDAVKTGQGAFYVQHKPSSEWGQPEPVHTAPAGQMDASLVTDSIGLRRMSNGGWVIEAAHARNSMMMGNSLGAFTDTDSMLVALGDLLRRKDVKRKETHDDAKQAG
ncbi:hypothetical protein [Roseicitreum antarcticum]|uniref:Uncharacterized protein n=1 Tax=Roseicitreum antarcticum TaxID=564137 RepID=A0A1H2YH31_9RHOB|nr:hypothetical protein [Roseicitreum antarcticum]SDX04522.1 hypothetical protein SAMN04488238_1058 [Roseicitreum antarcticum]